MHGKAGLGTHSEAYVGDEVAGVVDGDAFDLENTFVGHGDIAGNAVQPGAKN